MEENLEIPSVPQVPPPEILPAPQKYKRVIHPKLFGLGILVILVLMVLVFRGFIPKKHSGLPDTYAQCMSQTALSRFKENKLTCELYISQENKQYQDCLKYGKSGALHTDPGGDRPYCLLTYINPLVSLPADFKSCEDLGNMDKVNFPDACFINLDKNSFYDKVAGDKAYNQCLAQGGTDEYEQCTLLFTRPVSETVPVASSFETCKLSGGMEVGKSFQPDDYYGRTSEVILLPECSISYNSVNNAGLFKQCVTNGGNVSPDISINSQPSQRCFLTFTTVPAELQPVTHPAVHLIFQNNSRNQVNNFILKNNILVVGLEYEGIYGLDLTNNRQLWFYPASWMSRDFVYLEKNTSLVTDFGATNGLKLRAINIADGKVLWTYTDSAVYPAISVENDNIRIKVSKDGAFIRSVLINGSSGTKMEDEAINQPWNTSFNNPGVAYKNLLLKSDFSQVYALDKTTGNTVWSTQLREGHSTANVSLDNLISINDRDILLVPYEGLIYALNPNTGKLDWTFCSRSIYRIVRLAGSSILLEAPDTNLYSLDINQIKPGEKINLFPNTKSLSCSF